MRSKRNARRPFSWSRIASENDTSAALCWRTAVVDVVIVIGDVVAQRRRLRLGRGPSVERQIVLRVVAGDGLRERRLDRPIMLDGAFERFPGQVEPIEIRVAVLERRQDAQRLVVMRKAAVLAHGLVERLLAGMAEGRVAEVMRQRQRLGEMLIQAQRPRQAARDLRHFEAVRQPGAVVVALVIDEDLGLVLQTPEGRRMDDAVAVALERRATRAFWLLTESAAALVWHRGIRGKRRHNRGLDIHGGKLILGLNRRNAAV